MTLKDTLNVVVSAAVTGGLTAVAAAVGDPAHFTVENWKLYATTFAGGALFSVVNHLRQSPLQK